MSASPSTPTPASGPPEGKRKAAKRPTRETVRAVGLVVLAVLITLFAVLNTKEVKVKWVFGSGKAPLIIVIVVSLLVGIVLAYFADRRPRKRR
jgi:uncharacterized integral membrane protein